MRLDARVKRLEDAQGKIAPDMSGYDDRRDYDGHVWYFCDADGADVVSVSLFARTDGKYQFEFEGELWGFLPAGTKFRRSVRSSDGDFEVIDGVMRELHFPPSDGKLSPETEAAITWLFEN